MKNVKHEQIIGLTTRYYARGIEAETRNMCDKLRLNGVDEKLIHLMEHRTQCYIDSLLLESDFYEESAGKYYQLENNIRSIPIIGRWLWKKVKP